MEDCRPAEGGGYSYYQTLLKAIDSYTFHSNIEIVNLNFYKTVPQQLHLTKRVINVKRTFFGAIVYRSLYMIYRIIHYLFGVNAKPALEIISRFMDGINNRAALRLIKKESIHLVYYLKPQENLINYPMVVTHWDVGHKSMYPFPEVSWNGNFAKRNNYYENILSKAFLVLCESETGAKELQKYYPVNADKVRVLPLFGGDVVAQEVSEDAQQVILSKYNLAKEKFFLYPAQFWAHKNHSTLIEAFYLLLKESGNESLKLVLCGGDQGNLSYIKEIIDQLDLNRNVILPGFVSIKHLYTLYKNAIALVMPTFLGPTNIPLIEASQLKCAIVCSNLPGHKEIIGDSALYFDPCNVSDIKNCLQNILNSEMRKQLVSAAYQQIKNSSFQVEKSIPLLDKFLQHIKAARMAWGFNVKFFFAFI